MANKRSRKAVLGFESLERRETPSTLLGTGGPVAEAAVQEQSQIAARAVSLFNGSGTATFIKEIPLRNGGLFVIGVIRGSGSPTGPIVGVENTVFAPGLKSFHTNAVFQTADRSRLVLNITSRFQTGPTSGVATFSIVAGTGRYAHASGNGILNGTVSLPNRTLTFNYRGILRT